jgi:hypothetical protein
MCAAVALAGCGGGADGGEAQEPAVAAPDATALLGYLPPNPPEIALVDLAAARADLGLPADADASELGGSDAQSDLGAAAGSVIPYLSLPRRRPIQDAIDHRAITAAAGNLVQGGPGITAIATAQPLDDIGQRLITEGYERHGDILESDSSFVQGSYSVIADTGDGVLVLGFSRGTVERATEDAAAADNPARPLIEEVSGVTRKALVTDDLDCIDGIGVGQSADLDSGEIRIEVAEEASGERFRLADALTLPEFEFGKPDVDESVLTAHVEVDPQSGLLNGPISLLGTDLAPSEIYDC